MVTHYFTLYALSKELHNVLKGAVVQEIFTQEKSELVVSLQKNGDNFYLCISVEPKRNFIFTRHTFSRAKKNSADLFKTIVSQTISGIDVQSYERTMQIFFENSMALSVQLYNTSASNILLYDKQSLVLEAFKRNKELLGTTLGKKESRFDDRVLNDIEQWKLFFNQHSDENVLTSVKKLLPTLGSTFTREVLYRSQVSEETPTKNLSALNIKTMMNNTGAIFNELERSHPIIYYNSDVPNVLSVIALRHLANSKSNSFESVNEAVRTFLAQSLKIQHSDSEKNILEKKLHHLVDKAQQTLSGINKQQNDSKRAGEYEHIGSLIVANLQSLTKGMREAELSDYIENSKPVRISLDQKLSPQQNAERYFDKAKKIKLATTETMQRRNQLMQTLSSLEQLLQHLSHCETSEDVMKFRQTYEAELKKLGVKTKEEDKNPIPFRVFTVAGGFEVWVGKSSANNDLLTMKYAKPNDFWFHARGTSGSHTVLKVPNKNSSPPKEAIIQAARIAAYYSKMRNAKNVPVAYCERKYVRKQKRLAEGSVILEREEVIFVQPALP